MKHLILSLSLTFLFAALAYAQDANSTRFTSAAGAYSVLLPAEPTLSEQEASSDDGTKFTQYMAQSEITNQLFMVAYFDMQPGGSYSLEKGRDGMVKAVKG